VTRALDPKLYVTLPRETIRALVNICDEVVRRWSVSPAEGMRDKASSVETEICRIEAEIAIHDVRVRLWGVVGLPCAPPPPPTPAAAEVNGTKKEE
jgi:hypothetical protein